MTTLGWIGFLVIVLAVACWPLGRSIVRGIIRQRRLDALAVPDDPAWSNRPLAPPPLPPGAPSPPPPRR